MAGDKTMTEIVRQYGTIAENLTHSTNASEVVHQPGVSNFD